jgi:hypothetical protein
MIRALEEGGSQGALPAELCRLCGISARTARLWCNPKLSTYNEAFADAFDYALTLSEAFWEGLGRIGVFGGIQNFKDRGYQFIMDRSFSRTKGNVSDALSTQEYHDALVLKEKTNTQESEVKEEAVPEAPIEAYRWLIGEK